jgi:hypothetical protein
MPLGDNAWDEATSGPRYKGLALPVRALADTRHSRWHRAVVPVSRSL